MTKISEDRFHLPGEREIILEGNELIIVSLVLLLIAHALQVGGSDPRKYLSRKKSQIVFGILNRYNIAQTIFSIEY